MEGEHVIYTPCSVQSSGTKFMLKLQRVAGACLGGQEQFKVVRTGHHPGRETTELDAWLDPAGHNNCLLPLSIV